MNRNHTTQDIENSQWLTISEDEEVVWWGHPSLIPMAPTMFLGVVVAILGVYATIAYYDTLELLPLIAIPVGLGIALFEYLRFISVFYVVTSNKVTRKEGIVRRDTLDVRFTDIEHSRANQSPLERFLGYGDIEVATAGTAISELYLDNVSEPKHVNQLLDTGQDLGRIPENQEEEEALINQKKYPNGRNEQ